MAEQHQYGVIVAKNPQQTKASACRCWLTDMTKLHKDDLHSINQSIPNDGRSAADPWEWTMVH